MTQINLKTRQSGLALILSLLLLFILTLVAVGSFSSTHIQERAATNLKLQTLAFEAAAAGASNSIDFFLTMSDVSGYAPDNQCGARDHTGWGDENPTEWQEITYEVENIDLGDVDVRLFQQMYCINDEYPCGVGEVGCVEGARPERSQLFVLSRGQVWSGGEIVATREVEVRVDRRNTVYTVEGCGAICFPACEAEFIDGPGNNDGYAVEFPASNAFTVDGADGAAVTTGKNCDANPDLYELIMADIGDTRLGNYDGEVHRSDPGEPWNDPTNTDIFREQVYLESLKSEEGNLNITDGFVAPSGIDGSYENGVYTDNGNTAYGEYPDSPMVTYIDGDLEMGGGISGAGIMMVTGDIYWNGTPDYKGLIVSLGGSYTIDGGGVGGTHAGSVVVLNNNGETGCSNDSPSSCSDFGAISWLNEGGGVAEYNWDCEALGMAFSQIEDVVGDLTDNWGLDCERAPPTLLDGPADLVIASWRENIGWRENYFASP